MTQRQCVVRALHRHANRTSNVSDAFKTTNCEGEQGGGVRPSIFIQRVEFRVYDAVGKLGRCLYSPRKLVGPVMAAAVTVTAFFSTRSCMG
jgi:hypothetical protein